METKPLLVKINTGLTIHLIVFFFKTNSRSKGSSSKSNSRNNSVSSNCSTSSTNSLSSVVSSVSSISSISSISKNLGAADQKPKKKKTPRACGHCQKAHLTCDEGKLYYIVLFYFILIKESAMQI